MNFDFSREIACAIGLNGAILLSYFERLRGMAVPFNQTKNTVVTDYFSGAYKTFSFWTEKEFNEALLSLIKSGFITIVSISNNAFTFSFGETYDRYR